MKKHKLSIRQVVNVINAIAMVEHLDVLDSKTTFWLSQTKEQLVPFNKPYEKVREKLQKETVTSVKGKSESDIAKINEEYKDKINNLLDEPIDEIELYGFKRDMFEAKDVIVSFTKVMTEKGESLIPRTIQKGQSLVPIKFFSLMGNLIEE
jgi:hypothetical protein